MGRKPAQTRGGESELGAFVMAAMGRLVQVMPPATEPAAAGHQLEEILQSVVGVPWLRAWATDLLSKLDGLSNEKWSHGFIGFCQRWAALLSAW